MYPRIVYLRIIAVAVLFFSIFKISSYISLANTLLHFNSNEGEKNIQTTENPEVKGVEAINKNIIDDKVLISRLSAEDQYDLYLIKEDGTEERITDTPYNEMNAQFSPDGQSIIFAANPDPSDYDILRMDLKTRETSNITNNTSNDWDPTFSPDGSLVVFMSNRFDKGKGNGDILVMGPYGENPRNLTAKMSATEEWVPTFSPDGNTIYFVSGTEEESEIYSLEMSSNKITQLTDNTRDDWYPKASDNGLLITYVCKNPSLVSGVDQICVMATDGSFPRFIPNQPLEGDNGDPVFGKSGNTIYFLHLEKEANTYNLYSIDLNGQNLTKITKGTEKVLSPAVMPRV